ncbi:LPXTG cell wall anchor domain-containing protein [Maribacter algarum]|uniref:LPXTG cell wall anchor domain-containing protein n=1 Tax=Maribacter algarum (ex Zhang et al. 2020) TaxID=2578118 RepID=A0A5S3PYF6_9FLAO|nr:LPXTG cell wall anchor domain-containing protein [Maribacter algarum]
MESMVFGAMILMTLTSALLLLRKKKMVESN